jgi:hypothetical protein
MLDDERVIRHSLDGAAYEAAAREKLDFNPFARAQALDRRPSSRLREQR